MKSSLLTLALLSLLPAGEALAAIAVGDRLKFDTTDAYRIPSTGGGEFRFRLLDAIGNPTGPAYYTFCLERNEYLDFSSTFRVSSISSAAHAGGIGGHPPGIDDPISIGTNHLFSNYATGGLEGFGGYTRLSPTPAINHAWGGALQAVIWRLENEVDNTYNNLLNTAPDSALAKANDLWDELLGIFGTSPITGLQSDALAGSVRVMNIVYDTSGGLAQSQLILVPSPLVPPVPEPISLLVWTTLFGIGSVHYVRKRRRAL